MLHGDDDDDDDSVTESSNKSEHLFNGVERSPSSRQIIRVINITTVFRLSPRLVAARRAPRLKREESKVSIRHVVVLGSEQKARHGRLP